MPINICVNRVLVHLKKSVRNSILNVVLHGYSHSEFGKNDSVSLGNDESMDSPRFAGVKIMSGSLRYKKPTICEYLASSICKSGEWSTPWLDPYWEFALNVPESLMRQLFSLVRKASATLQEIYSEKTTLRVMCGKRIERSIFPTIKKNHGG